jgi:ssDNA-binding Zn-finger/Zn-ribbon topoisomerase 1
MSRDILTIGGCPKCASDQLACRYNHFEKSDLKIISWEHKCPNCGHRETKAFRSDEEESDDEPDDEDWDPATCPYCARPAPF